MTDIINTLEDGTIQIIYERGSDPWIYRDALYYTATEYENLSEADMEAEKDRRYNNWYGIVTDSIGEGE